MWIIDHGVDTFLVKWTSFNKDFFMEKEGDIFKELNKSFLLDTIEIHRHNMKTSLSLLNSSYNDGYKEKKTYSEGYSSKENT